MAAATDPVAFKGLYYMTRFMLPGSLTPGGHFAGDF